MRRTMVPNSTCSIAPLVAATLLFASGGEALAEDQLPPQISHEPCEFFKKGESFEIRARFYDDSPIFDPKVLYRTRRDSNWKSAPFARAPDSEDFATTIPKRDLRGAVEYFIEAFDENGNGPAQYGSPDAPVKMRASTEPPACVQVSATDTSPMRTLDSASREQPFDATGGQTPAPATGCSAANAPLYCSPWLWGSMGAVAILGGGFAVYWFAIRGDTPPDQRANIITLNVTGGDPTVGLGP